MKCKIDSVNLISALANGSTDAAIIDQEAVFARYLDTDLSGLDLVKISTNFVSIKDVSADAQGVIDSLENAFKRIGNKDIGKKIIAYGTYGASTKRGQLNGVLGLLCMVLGS